MFFLVAWFVGTPREQLRRVIPARELIWMICILAAFIAGGWVFEAGGGLLLRAD
jgi:hypothetical protein